MHARAACRAEKPAALRRRAEVATQKRGAGHPQMPEELAGRGRVASSDARSEGDGSHADCFSTRPPGPANAAGASPGRAVRVGHIEPRDEPGETHTPRMGLAGSSVRHRCPPSRIVGRSPIPG
jgi:hypothetical protein